MQGVSKSYLKEITPTCSANSHPKPQFDLKLSYINILKNGSASPPPITQVVCELCYNLHFGFTQQYSTSYALINITENIRKALDDASIGCGVFMDSQKAFDTVDHQILLAKLNHYGIRGVLNDWFKSYLSNRSQYVSINGYESGLAALNCGVPQGSVLGPLLFLLYINDLNQAIKFCKVHHFADDTNLLCLSNSIKKLNKLVNADLKHLVNWSNANKISLNVKKTPEL